MDKSRDKNFKPGDLVVMHTCGEADFYPGKIWTVSHGSFRREEGGHEVCFLEGFSGSFDCAFLQLVKVSEYLEKSETLPGEPT